MISDARAYFNVCILKEPIFAQIHSKLNSGSDLQINFVNRFIKTFTIHQGVQEVFLDISTKVLSYSTVQCSTILSYSTVLSYRTAQHSTVHFLFCPKDDFSTIYLCLHKNSDHVGNISKDFFHLQRHGKNTSRTDLYPLKSVTD